MRQFLLHALYLFAAFGAGVVLSQKVKDLLSGISADLRAKAKAEADKVIAAAKSHL